MLRNSTWPSIQKIPKRLTIYIVFQTVKLLNFFPTKSGLSDTLIPKTIMSSEILDYKKHLSLQIGQYCLVHEEDSPCNGKNPRTKGAISLGPNRNFQDGFKFMALNTENNKKIGAVWILSQFRIQCLIKSTLLSVINPSN